MLYQPAVPAPHPKSSVFRRSEIVSQVFDLQAATDGDEQAMVNLFEELDATIPEGSAHNEALSTMLSAGSIRRYESEAEVGRFAQVAANHFVRPVEATAHDGFWLLAVVR